MSWFFHNLFADNQDSKLNWDQWYPVATSCAVLVLIVTIVFLVLGALNKGRNWWLPILIVWLIGVPAYFVIEFRMLKDEVRTDPVYRDDRELAEKVWLAIVVTLAALYLGDLMKANATGALKPDPKDSEKKYEETRTRIKSLEDKLQVLLQLLQPAQISLASGSHSLPPAPAPPHLDIKDKAPIPLQPPGTPSEPPR
jgi:hypothetical protein